MFTLLPMMTTYKVATSLRSVAAFLVDHILFAFPSVSRKTIVLSFGTCQGKTRSKILARDPSFQPDVAQNIFSGSEVLLGGLELYPLLVFVTNHPSYEKKEMVLFYKKHAMLPLITPLHVRINFSGNF